MYEGAVDDGCCFRLVAANPAPHTPGDEEWAAHREKKGGKERGSARGGANAAAAPHAATCPRQNGCVWCARHRARLRHRREE